MRELRFYAALFARRIHWLLLAVLLGALVGLAAGRMITPIYEARALLVVEGDRIPDRLAASTAHTDTNAKLQVIRKRVLSRESLLDMARRMALFPDLRTETGARDADAVFEALKNSVAIEISEQSRSRSAPKDATFMTVSFRAGAPARAARVANELVTRILKEDAAIRTKAARDTLDFFSREVDRLEAELSKSSAAILQFKQENGDALPEELPLLRDRLAAVQADAETRLAHVNETETEIDRLVRLREAAGRKVDRDAIYPPAARELSRLEAQRDALKPLLPADDARLAALGAQIQELSQQAQLPLPKAKSAFENRLRELTDALFVAQAAGEAADLKMTQLREAMAKVPANASALEALRRDHDNLADQYDSAVQARAVAETGDTIESLAKGEKLTVIDQAVAPGEPVKPNRKTLALAGVGVGLLLGLVAIALKELLSTGIRRPEDLQRHLGIAAFATLPYLSAPEDARRRRRNIVVSGSMVGGAFIAVVVLFSAFYMPLDRLF